MMSPAELMTLDELLGEIAACHSDVQPCPYCQRLRVEVAKRAGVVVSHAEQDAEAGQRHIRNTND